MAKIIVKGDRTKSKMRHKNNFNLLYEVDKMAIDL